MISTETNNFSQACRGDACFAAGTLVHTQEGLKPIEKIAIGDWVLSQLEETGEKAYKRVVRTAKFEDKAVFRILCSAVSNGQYESHSLIVTGNYPFYVSGHNTEDIGGCPEDDSKKPTGWLRVDSLRYGAVLQLAGGATQSVEMADPIWRSCTEGIGWIGARDYEVGHFIDLRGAVIQETFGTGETSDFFGVDDFNERYEDEELTDKWVYKCAVYNFEVEDFHTYYVGELGVWVHDSQ